MLLSIAFIEESDADARVRNAIGAVIIGRWIAHGLGSLSEERVTILAATLLIVGVQIFFTSFLLSLLGLRRRSLTDA